MPRKPAASRPHPKLPTDEQTQANTMDGRWGFASYGAGPRCWWVGRKIAGQTEMARDAHGAGRWFGSSRDGADAADRLNALDAEAFEAMAAA